MTLAARVKDKGLCATVQIISICAPTSIRSKQTIKPNHRVWR